MNRIVSKFNTWIKKHKLFALAAPIIVLLSTFFISTSIKSMTSNGTDRIVKDGYNNFLPDQKNEIDVQEPNDIYKKSQRDSLNALRQGGLFRNLVDTKRENDSLEGILEELNRFSLDTENVALENEGTDVESQLTKPEFVAKKTAAQEKFEYRKLLLEARDERQSRSQDYSAPHSEKDNKTNSSKIRFDASIYRDQFILPGNRVILILGKDVFLDGIHIPKNTFIYATANIQGSRVLLDISGINTIRRSLVAIDQQDGMIGLHNERASELLQEFKADIQEQGVNELSDTVGEISEMPLAKNMVRSFGNFFQRRKYKQRDKILLVNGDRVFLIPKE